MNSNTTVVAHMFDVKYCCLSMHATKETKTGFVDTYLGTGPYFFKFSTLSFHLTNVVCTLDVFENSKPLSERLQIVEMIYNNNL